MSGVQKNRLESGGRIDRSRLLKFKFNGKDLEGYQGDTIASALLANGAATVNRSFKYHRPRGVMSAGVEETNALLTVAGSNGELPVVRTTVRALEEGHLIKSPGGFPSVNFDLGRFLDFTHSLWPAGFYNKVFKWPNWHFFERGVRRMAGLGELPQGEDPCRYFHHNLHCDVMIVGAGPAGLGAALSATASGARVLLVEQDHELGGSLLADGAQIDGVDSDAWLKGTEALLEGAANTTIMTSSTVSGYYDHNVLTITDRSTPGIKRLWKVRAKQVLLATGAIEQPLVFENNDRPGIILAGAAMEYVSRYAVKPANVMAVATNNYTAYRVAFALHDQGIRVAAIIDAREKIADELVEQANRRGIPVKPGCVVLNADGGRTLSGITIGKLTGDTQSPIRPASTVTCQGLAMSGGFNPDVALYSQARGKLRYDSGLACFLPGGDSKFMVVAGAARGQFGLAEALADGAAAGSGAANRAGFECSAAVITTSATSGYGLEPIRITPAGNTSRQWVDFMHDVTVADIELAVRENFVSVEHLKRYTTTGMSADQGKTSNLNALTLLASLTNRPIEEVGTTTFRPQYMPVPLGAVAGQQRGELFAPERRLPAHDWHARQGAVFVDYGAWKRPEYYVVNGRDRETAIREEVLAVRRGTGLFDASPLGKIELKGPDAGEFLNRIFVNNALTLKTGRIRYGLMLNENGIVMDDGVFACLADDHYLLSTTSAHADHFFEWLEHWHQCEWPQLELIISPVTGQWGVVTVAGPNARGLLQELDSDIDFSARALPHMAVATGAFLGFPARVQRVSFTGEMSYEINVPAVHCQRLFETVMSAAGDRIRPIGIEALMVLRTEKGYLDVGGDTDGTTNPLDVGFAGIVAKKQGDFIGKRSLLRALDQSDNRRQFVGVEPLKHDEVLLPGAHFVTPDARNRRSEGMVTSACFSPSLNRTIGLGLLERGFARKGETVTVFDDGRTFEVRITEPVFYDPAGEKLNA